MKHIVSTFLLLTFAILHCWTKDISSSKAEYLASKAMTDRVDGFTYTTATVTPVIKNGVTSMYVVNFQPQGWLLLSADDAISPVLGYSECGQFTTLDAPDNVSAWLTRYDDIIQCAKQNGNNKRSAEWDFLDDTANNSKLTAPNKAAQTNKVLPLISVAWNQSGRYKKYCPSNKDGQAIVGCVAVSMAQAMSVCKYPARPFGSHSYVSSTYGTLYINYDNEPAYNWSDIINGANDLDDVARLLYHCGVSVDMDYNPSGSGTQSSYIVSALKRNFNYPSCVTHYDRSSYNDDEWKALVINELVNGRPICYHGVDTKGNYGHAFNVDGYDGNNMFHVNWGWGGSNDGYFYLNKLQDNTMNMVYDAQIGMVAGIRPPSENPSDISLSQTNIMAGLPAGTEVATITVESEATNPEYTFNIQGPYSVVLHKYITPPFEIIDSKLVTTEPLSYDPTDNEWPITITVTNVNTMVSFTKSFSIYVTNIAGIINLKIGNDDKMEFYDLNGRRITDSDRHGVCIKRFNGKLYKVINK